MSSLISGLQNLVSSVFEILTGILNSFVSAIQSVFGLAQDLISSIFDLMSGIVGFVLGELKFSCSGNGCARVGRVWMEGTGDADGGFVGNIVIIGVLVAAYVGYSAYRQKNQGGGITGGVKKTS